MQDLNVKENKIIQLPNCFDALRQKVNVEYDGQSSYKERETRNRVRPVQAAAELELSETTEGNGNKSPSSVTKSPKNKKLPRNKSKQSGGGKKVTAANELPAEPDLASADGLTQPTSTSGDTVEPAMETEQSPVSPSGEDEMQQDDGGLADGYEQLSVDGGVITGAEKSATM
jgi:hypothetical protein